jgi:WD40 repeat protein
MTLKNDWKLPAVGCGALALLAVLFRPADRTDLSPGPEPAATLAGHHSTVQALGFGPDGATLTAVACHLDAVGGAEVVVWDVSAAAPAAWRTEAVGPFAYFAFTPGGRRIATTQGQSLRLWDPATPGGSQLCELPSPAPALAFAPAGRHLAVADNANRVSLWAAAVGRPWTRCPGPAHPAYALAIAPDGGTLAGALHDGTIRLWEVATGEERGVLGGHAAAAWAVAFSPDGRLLASGDAGGPPPQDHPLGRGVLA